MLAAVLAVVIVVPDPGLETLAAADARVASIGWHLQTANVALCTDVAQLPGFAVQTLTQYRPADRAAVTAATGLQARPTIMSVVPASAADKAGLKPGDVLVAIAGVSTSGTVAQKQSYAATDQAQTAIAAGLAHPPLALRVMRGANETAVALTGDNGCASQIELLPGSALNAEADGKYVQIAGALVAFTRNDDELAVAMAHELSHNILHHRDRLEHAGVARGLFAGLGKGGVQLRAVELEADRFGVWLMARAGYNLDAVVPFWTRFAGKTGLGILSDGTHPSWKARIAAVTAAVAEVRAQRAAGMPLVPTGLVAQQSSSQPQIRR